MATPMDVKTLTHVAQYLIAARRAEMMRFSQIYEYVKNRIIDIYVPKRATAEYHKLVDQAKFNILPLLESSLANNFFIDGYRPGRSARNATIWDRAWQPNRMDARQAGLWRSALRYGLSYATVLPGERDGEKTPVITPWSPRRLTALYEDPINDEWPVYFMTVGTARPQFGPDGVSVVTPVSVYDGTHRYGVDLPAAMLATQVYGQVPLKLPPVEQVTIDTGRARVSEHGLGLPPAVRFMGPLDLDDCSEGVIEPMLPAQRQLNQTTFGLLMAQQYAAFKQRWVTGMAIDEDENGNPINPFNAAVDALFQAESPDTKFGEFAETNLDGYLTSRDKALLYVASVRHLRPHTLVVGDAVSNISAEALAALDAEHQQDISAWKTSLGESGEQVLRLSGKAIDDREAWEDTSAQVKWRDTTPRSLAQVADALGKLAQLLGIPAEELWEKVPGVTDQDLERWKKAKKESDAFARLEGMLNARRGGESADPAAPGGNPGDGQPGDRPGAVAGSVGADR